MLTPQEEAQIREELAARRPMTVVNPQHIDPRGDNESAHAAARYVNDQLRRAKTKPVDLNEDPEVSKKLRKLKFSETETAIVNGFSVVVTFPKESFIERFLFGSTLAPGDAYALGISREDILRLPVDELKRRVINARAEMIEAGNGGFAPHGPADGQSRPTNPAFVDTAAVNHEAEYEQGVPEAI